MIKQVRSTFKQFIGLAGSALKYQHCGDMLSRSGKMTVINGDHKTLGIKVPPIVKLESKKMPSKKILLAFDTTIDETMIRYTRQVARQYDAEIDVLCNLESSEVNLLMAGRRFNRRTVKWNLIKLESDIQSEITHYIARQPELLFVVSNLCKTMLSCSDQAHKAA